MMTADDPDLLAAARRLAFARLGEPRDHELIKAQALATIAGAEQLKRIADALALLVHADLAGDGPPAVFPEPELLSDPRAGEPDEEGGEA